MKALFSVFLLSAVLLSCGTSKTGYADKIPLDRSEGRIPKNGKANPKKTATTTKRKPTRAETTNPNYSKTENIIHTAKSYDGTRYKFGGTTASGMDCSGLIYVAFQEEGIALPRVSRDMARRGSPLKYTDIQPGDLLFFKTNPNKNSINHVGLVVDVLPGKILFIHATTSEGVLISALEESYWNKAFTEARRVL